MRVVMILGFGRMKEDLSLTDLVVNKPMMTILDFLREYEHFTRYKSCGRDILTCHSSIANTYSVYSRIYVCHHVS
jgi:hypothetical protein